MAAAELLEMQGVVLHDQFLRRQAEVPEEPLGDFEALHDPARQGGKIREEVVSAAVPELVPEGAGPILSAHFPAVDMEEGPTRSSRDLAGADLTEKRADEGVEVGIESGLVELVTLEAQAGHGSRTGGRGVGRPAETQDGPAAV